MDIPTVVTIMLWLIGGLLGALVGSWVWFGRRVVTQLEMMRESVNEAVHSHDIRITRLEDWRAMVTDVRRQGPSGIV